MAGPDRRLIRRPDRGVEGVPGVVGSLSMNEEQIPTGEPYSSTRLWTNYYSETLTVNSTSSQEVDLTRQENLNHPAKTGYITNDDNTAVINIFLNKESRPIAVKAGETWTLNPSDKLVVWEFKITTSTVTDVSTRAFFA